MLSTLWAAGLLTAEIPLKGSFGESSLVQMAQVSTGTDPKAAFQRGMTAFQVNDFAAAIAAWEQALAGFTAAGDD